MAGVEAAEDLTLEQLNAMAGGELLKAEVSVFLYSIIFHINFLHILLRQDILVKLEIQKNHLYG